MKETELARKVITYLQDLQWDVYQEVQIFDRGAVADIVAKQGPVIWVIETKMSFGLNVMAQAYNWLPWANRVSIAIPYGRRQVGQIGLRFPDMLCKHFGIGILKVSSFEDTREIVHEILNPGFRRIRSTQILNALNEGHTTFAEAGNDKGRRWSPFKETCLQVFRYVQNNEGCTVKELVERVSHHYASNSTARVCIPRWAEEGRVEGVKVVKEGGKWKFFTKEANE